MKKWIKLVIVIALAAGVIYTIFNGMNPIVFVISLFCGGMLVIDIYNEQ